MRNSIGRGYLDLSNYLKKSDINNFRQNEKNFNYAIEHVGNSSIENGKKSFNAIQKLDMITLNQLNELLELNDKIGNPYKTKKISDKIIQCNPNTLKYIYFGLLIIKHFIQTNINNINFIEIGGGYGGQCLILLKLFNIFNINIKKYILIDLQNVVDFQEKYLTAHKINDKCKFISYTNYTNYNFNNNNYLFSCYSFNEILPFVRQHYYTNLFPYIKNGSFIWPTKNIDLQISYKQISLNIFGKFITF